MGPKLQRRYWLQSAKIGAPKKSEAISTLNMPGSAQGPDGGAVHHCTHHYDLAPGIRTP